MVKGSRGRRRSYPGLARRLDALETRLGAHTDDFGPHMVVTILRRWEMDRPEEAVQPAAERERIDEALDALRAEARARRSHVDCCVARINAAGEAELRGAPGWMVGAWSGDEGRMQSCRARRASVSADALRATTQRTPSRAFPCPHECDVQRLHLHASCTMHHALLQGPVWRITTQTR